LEEITETSGLDLFPAEKSWEKEEGAGKEMSTGPFFFAYEARLTSITLTTPSVRSSE
jgi:hypothetical protein